MSPDRTGDTDADPEPCCRGGWVGLDDEGRPIPCLHHKPHLRRTTDIDPFAGRHPAPPQPDRKHDR